MNRTAVTRRVAWAAVIAVLAAICLVSAGCNNRRSRLSPPADDPAATLGEPLLIALAQAKNFHHRADVHLADGDTEAAIQDVMNILTIEFPAGAPEAEDTLLDARARIGKLYLGLGKLDDAERIVDQGIEEAERESFFLANLNTVQGEIRHARAKTIADPDAARAERHRAIESFDRSIAINKKLQKRLHEEAGR